MERSLREKQQKLAELIRPMGRVLVAFSGGVDSSFLLASCCRILETRNVLAVIGDSPTLARGELEDALGCASSLGVSTEVIATGELEDENFLRNPEDRCYYCKRELFRKLHPIALQAQIKAIVDGTNVDDVAGHRPGRRAAEEFGVLSPLAIAGFRKPDIRELSREMGLHTWNKPAMACLASRFPYGQMITQDGLHRIEQAEVILRKMGFRNVRVRDHAGLARIEVDEEDIPKLLAGRVSALLAGLGFKYITADLDGFRSGSLSPVKPTGGREGKDEFS